MWATTVSFPCYAKPARATSRSSLTNFTSRNSLKLRASLLEYPLASRIMVRNLPYSANESSLQKEFSNFGQIAEVKLVKNGAMNRSKGYAFIQYTCQEDAMLALENMDYKNFDGRVIYVELAKPGGDAFGGYPRTSGPPKVRQLQEQDKVPEQDEIQTVAKTLRMHRNEWVENADRLVAGKCHEFGRAIKDRIQERLRGQQLIGFPVHEFGKGEKKTYKFPKIGGFSDFISKLLLVSSV